MWGFTQIGICYASLTSTRKIVIGSFALLIFVIYLWPSRLLSDKNIFENGLNDWTFTVPKSLGELEQCLESRLDLLRKTAGSFDFMINHIPPLKEERVFVPFIGNGYVGLPVNSSGKLYIKFNRTLGIPVSYSPIIEFEQTRYKSTGVVVLNILEGSVWNIVCLTMIDGSCVSATSKSYAHRKRHHVLFQQLQIKNPSNVSVTFTLKQNAGSIWMGSSSYDKSVAIDGFGSVGYTLTHGRVYHEDTKDSFVVVLASTKAPQTVTLKPFSKWTFNVITVLRYKLEKPNRLKAVALELGQQVQEEMKMVLNMESKSLKFEHTSIWMNLWRSGFGISLSLAAGALNGDTINTTIYQVISHVADPSVDENQTENELLDTNKFLTSPSHCYDGHQTLQNMKMWQDSGRVEDVIALVNLWLITLEKQGCANLVKAGPPGVLQAMLLSIGGLKFSSDHLEFNTHPRDLHRDYFFRRINYGNDTHVNISVVVNEDNKAVLYVSLDRNNRPYYACDAGCLDEPLKLNESIASFPVKLTDPLTAILYITSDKQHMEELKHAIHVREIVEAPAHQHHVLIQHRHGHPLNSLPNLFWISIGSLITVFHLFLFKLIYNEYCSGSESAMVLDPLNYSPSRKFHYSVMLRGKS